MSAFHASVARYTFAAARDRLLPGFFARVTHTNQFLRGGAPWGGSVLQSAVAAVVLLIAWRTHADPQVVIFTWFSTVAGVGVLLLLIAAAGASALWFFYDKDAPKVSFWVQWIAPVLGIGSGVWVLWLMVSNLDGLLSLPPGSRLMWLVLAIVMVTVLAGLVWGTALCVARPQVWQAIGRGAPSGTIVKDDRLSRIRV